MFSLFQVALAATDQLKSFCSGESLCVYGSVIGNSINFTIHSSATGYAAFGIGESMSSAQMYVAWNFDNGVQVISAYSTRHSQPQVTNPQDITVLPLQVPAPKWAKISASFNRPLDQPKSKVSSGSKFIYAYSNTPPQDPKSINSAYDFHDRFGLAGVVDFFSGSNTNVPSTSGPIVEYPVTWQPGYNLLVHGILMTIAWGVLPFFGIYIAFNKSWTWWFNIHRLIFAATFLLAIAGFFMVFLFETPPHFVGFHSVIGLLVLIGMVVQVGLGIYIDRMFDEQRSSVPLRDKLHWYLGRILVAAALLNIILGLVEYGEAFQVSVAFYVVYSIWVVVASAFLVYAKYKSSSEHGPYEQLTRNQ